ncbi:hypothetical protein RN001_009586 [Aquatica leii]|uniref:RNA helicase n=1 Tax=Aquatica leii TaxID=1421715 RepID=A0AAN7SQ01_9COLE|nr:hypothetical protein RN001_009586 [Aquatica leii]
MTTIAHKIEEKPRTEDVYTQSNCTFDSFLLSPLVSRGLLEAGFYKPSPIQVKAIPLGKCGLDLIVKAKSGTGKTLVFATIALEMVKTNVKSLQALIIAPTREIADQIVGVIKTVGKHIDGLNVGLFIGGLSFEDDVKRAKDCHIAVGAPGRIKHLVEQKHLNLKTVKLFVLDEADKLMTEDFQNDINYFYHLLPEQKQFLAVSATMTDDLNTFLERYMYSPTYVTPEIDNSVLLGLRQFVSIVDEKSTVVQQFKTKIDELVRIFGQIPFTQCLVFSNYQQRTESISNMINQQGWKSMYITGAQSQQTRLKIVDKLKKLECKILLTTDLTARGIDASNVDLVINYDVPADSATYLHRMGRTGRYGSLGICVTIASKGKELMDLQHILGDIGGSEIAIAQLPGGIISEDVWKCELNVFEKVQGVVDEHREKVKWEMSDEALSNKSKKKSRRDNKEVSKKFRNLTVEDSQIDTENRKNLESIEKLLKKKEVNDTNISLKYADISSESLLQCLAQGQVPEETTSSQVVCDTSENHEEMINPAELYPWVPVEESVLTKVTGVSLLEESDDSSFCSEDHLPLIKMEIFNKKLILTKNIALYYTCKILKSEDWNMSIVKEAVKPIKDYLALIKEETDIISKKLLEFTTGVKIDEICNKMVYYSEEFAQIKNSVSVNKKPPQPNICQIAYDHIVKGTADWRDIVGDQYKKKNTEPTYEQSMDVVEEEEESYNYYDSYNFNAVEQYDRRMHENETFKSYFDYYDQALAETAVNFEDVSMFKKWFEQWKTQVQSVTKCVQEKIYLAEMNNYEYYCNSYRQNF